ncbi:MAG: hypothetical protein GEU97_08175 [Actinophytocola sp.]|nr:hypothetical protein [Actinophytocola sp.]
MMDDLPYDGWPDFWEEHGTYPESADPVTIRVGIYRPNGDPDAGSIALCTSGGRPILIDEHAARELAGLLDWSVKAHRDDVRRLRKWRQAAARELVDAAVLSRDEFDQMKAAVEKDGNVEAIADILSACAPDSWHTDAGAQSSAES